MSYVPLGKRMTWFGWEPGLCVLYYLFHFTGLELECLWQLASRLSASASSQDALLADVWVSVNRARADDDDQVHLDSPWA